MKPFTRVTGNAAVLRRPNIDTDVIIRIERLTRGRRDELGRYAFEALRYLADGSDNPDFPLNRPEFRRAPILIAGRNFGCGSSREGAVWTLMRLGVRCIIAPSFGDIFYSNCFHNGVLPVVLDEKQVDSLAARAAGGATLTVDLEARFFVARRIVVRLRNRRHAARRTARRARRHRPDAARRRSNPRMASQRSREASLDLGSRSS